MEHDNTPSKISDEIARVKSDIAALKPELDAAEAELKAAEEHVETLKQRVYLSGNDSLRTRMSQLQRQLDKLETVRLVEPLGYPRVRIVDNWGAKSFYAGDTELKAGMAVSVAFEGKDTPLSAMLQGEKYHTTVGDMGHNYDVTGTKLYVLVPNEYGADAKIFLNAKMGVIVEDGGAR